MALDEEGDLQGGHWTRLDARGQDRCNEYNVKASIVLRRRNFDQNHLHGGCVPFILFYSQYMREGVCNLQRKDASELVEIIVRGAGSDQEGDHDQRRFEVYYLHSQTPDFLPAPIRVIKGHGVVKVDRPRSSPVTPEASRYVYHVGLFMNRVSIWNGGILRGRDAGVKGNRPECYFSLVYPSLPNSRWWHADSLCPCGAQRAQQHASFSCLGGGLGKNNHKRSPYFDACGRCSSFYDWNPFAHGIRNRDDMWKVDVEIAYRIGAWALVQVDCGVFISNSSVPAAALVSCCDAHPIFFFGRAKGAPSVEADPEAS